MARMLGKAALEHRQGGYWWWCCEGHDGTYKVYVELHKGAQRNREKTQWKKEAQEYL